MAAPDKIYLHEISAEELTENLPYHVCYIRKDALLEWFEKRLHEVGLAGMIHIIDVIDKINSM